MATLNVLEEVGVKFESTRGLKLLEKNGCRVDQDTRIAKIPAFLVEECIRRTPSSFLVRSRAEKDNLHIGGNTLYFMSSLGARLSDIESGEVRVPSMEENDEAVRISDARQTCSAEHDWFYFEVSEDVVEDGIFMPKVANRLPYKEWISSGKKDVIARAKERMEHIKSTHEPIALSAEKDHEIDRILKEARKYYKNKGLL